MIGNIAIIQHKFMYSSPGLFKDGDFNGGSEPHARDVTVNITGEIGLGIMIKNK